jgi:hypothetical protein
MLILAPWTDEQVRSLNAYQKAGYVHPFTSSSGSNLIATKAGWVEREGGPIVQRWAHEFMLDWSWKQPAFEESPTSSPDFDSDPDDGGD